MGQFIRVGPVGYNIYAVLLKVATVGGMFRGSFSSHCNITFL